MALCTLCAAFLAYDLRGSKLSLEDRLSTLAAIVGENSSAALEFSDPTTATEVLQRPPFGADRWSPHASTTGPDTCSPAIVVQYHPAAWTVLLRLQASHKTTTIL